MLRLRQETAPGWVPMINGAAVLARPASTLLVYTARAQAKTMLAALVEGEAILSHINVVLTGMPSLETEEEREGVQNTLFALCLAKLAVMDWRGVGDDDGTALAFNAGWLPYLLSQAAAAEAFINNYLNPIHEVEREGNV